jgi:hypothetical protein
MRLKNGIKKCEKKMWGKKCEKKNASKKNAIKKCEKKMR